MAIVESGNYFIENVKQKNIAAVVDNNIGSPLMASVHMNNIGEVWNVLRLSNEQYIIKNIECNFYAFSGSRSSKGNTVDGKVRTQYWRIQETREKGKFTISTTDTDVFWSLSDAEAKTPIELAEVSTDKRSWWIFREAPSTQTFDIKQTPQNESNEKIQEVSDGISERASSEVVPRCDNIQKTVEGMKAKGKSEDEIIATVSPLLKDINLHLGQMDGDVKWIQASSKNRSPNENSQQATASEQNLANSLQNMMTGVTAMFDSFDTLPRAKAALSKWRFAFNSVVINIFDGLDGLLGGVIGSVTGAGGQFKETVGLGSSMTPFDSQLHAKPNTSRGATGRAGSSAHSSRGFLSI